MHKREAVATRSQQKFPNSTLYRRLVMVLIAGSGLASAAAADLTRPIAFNIPAQPLAQALGDFSRQSDVIVVAASELTAGKRSKAVNTTTTAERALKRLLEGSRLVYTQEKDGTVIIRQPAQGAGSQTTAQSSDPQPDGPATFKDASGNSPKTAVEEVVVSALKRETRIQDTPTAVTALSGDLLKLRGTEDFRDYYRAVPSLQITENAAAPGEFRISLRGIYSAGDSTVGLYYGETPVAGPSGTTADAGLQMPNLNLFDVDHIEVLRGPQGTLYGASSVGGTVRVLFNKPDASKFSGNVETQGTTVARGGTGYDMKAALNMPIVDDLLAARGVFYTVYTPGYIDNIRYGYKDTNYGTTSGGRLALRASPSDAVDVQVTAIYQGTQIADNSTWYPKYGEGAYKTDQPVLEPYKDNFNLYNGTLNWDFGLAKLTATSSWYKWGMLRDIDVTPSLYGSVATTTAASVLCERYAGSFPTACSAAQLAAYKTYGFGVLPASLHGPLWLRSQNHEIRLASRSGGQLEWTLGGYFERRHDYIQSTVAQADAATGQVISPVVANGNRFVADDFKQFAQFAEVSVRPFERLTVTGGIRHYNMEKTVAAAVEQTAFILGSFAGPLSTVRASASGSVGKANVSYKLSDETLAYFQWGQGFRPGGANNLPGLSKPLVAYGPDSLESYEVGLKTGWDNSRYVLNLAAFQIDWSHMQSSLVVQPAFMVVVNAGDAVIRGIEGETANQILDDLTIRGSFSYLPNAKLTSAQAGGSIVVGPQNGLPGDRIPYTPDFTGSLSADFSPPVSATLHALVHLDVDYHGASANNFRPTYSYYEGLHPFTDASARVGIEGQRWGAYFFVNNLFDTVGELTTQSAFAVAPYQYKRQTGSLTPRTIGIDLRESF